uniref:Uncharacterized protein n=1 Tax=Meloidogyne enterolobii TaxID=390850 RepID=A0A6V7WQX8_MELEN|nr:unnamed protein product [Meloidogyne enterolobii]
MGVVRTGPIRKFSLIYLFSLSRIFFISQHNFLLIAHIILMILLEFPNNFQLQSKLKQNSHVFILQSLLKF